MKTAFLLFLCLFASVAARAESPESIPDPRKTNRSSIYDGAQVLSVEQERRIDARLLALERQTKAQIIVVTVQNLDGIPIEDFSNTLFRRLGIGGRGNDDGALFLFAIQDRKSRSEIGPGLQDRLTDARVTAILRDQVRPAFREGKYGNGISAAVEVAANYIEGGSRPNPGAPSTPGTNGTQNTQPSNGFPSNGFPTRRTSPRPASYPGEGLLILLVVGGGVATVVYLGSRPRKCSKCNSPMKEADAARVQAALTDAQNFEFHLGSRTFRGWQCPKCDSFELGAGDTLFSGWTRCENCHNRTAQSSTEILQYPSYTFPGLEQITEECQYPPCRHVGRRQRQIPRRQRSSSVIVVGSGGFGGGFGGGLGSGGWGSGGGGDSGGSYDGGFSSSLGGGDSDGGGGSSDW